MNLVNILYESFTKERKERAEQLVMSFSPSSLSACRRAYFWQRKGEQPTNPPDNASLFKMKMGDIIHDYIQHTLNDMGLLESFEEAKKIIYNNLEFNYYYDGILSFKNLPNNVDESGHRWIMEIKTVYANGFKSVENEPKPEHVLQALSYMKFENIDRAIILYAGRDNGYMLQYELRIMDEQPHGAWLLIDGKKTDYYAKWLAKIESLKGLKSAYSRNELPDRDFQMVFKFNGAEPATEFQKDNVKYRSDWQCNYCGFRDKCWGDVKANKDARFYINGKFI